MVTGGHILQPVAVQLLRVEGGAGRAHGAVGDAVGTLDEVGAVLRVGVHSVVHGLAERVHVCGEIIIIIIMSISSAHIQS